MENRPSTHRAFGSPRLRDWSRSEVENFGVNLKVSEPSCDGKYTCVSGCGVGRNCLQISRQQLKILV